MVIYLTCFVAGILIYSGNQKKNGEIFKSHALEIAAKVARQFWFNISFTMWIYGALGLIWTTVNAFT